MDLNPKSKKLQAEDQLDAFVNAANPNATPSVFDQYDDSVRKPVNVLLTEREIAMIDAARQAEAELTGTTPSRNGFMRGAAIIKAKKLLD